MLHEFAVTCTARKHAQTYWTGCSGIGGVSVCVCVCEATRVADLSVHAPSIYIS